MEGRARVHTSSTPRLTPAGPPGALRESEPKAASFCVCHPHTTLLEFTLGPPLHIASSAVTLVPSGARFPPSFIESKPVLQLATAVTVQGHHSCLLWDTDQALS